MSELDKKNNNEDDFRDLNRLEFIELGAVEFKPTSTPQLDQFQIEQPQIAPDDPTAEETLRKDTDLPDFPLTQEMWDDFKNSLSESRTIHHRTISKDDLRTSLEKAKIKPEERQAPRYIPPDGKQAETESWEIIIERQTGRAFGFSQGEYVNWMGKQPSSRIVAIKCSVCEREVYDNPLTGFHFCPYCESRMKILDDDIRAIREMQESALKETNRRSKSGVSFLSNQLDIPGRLISSLSLPKFSFSMTDYKGLYPPLAALLTLLALIIVMFILSNSIVTRIYLIIGIFIAIVINSIVLKRESGIVRIDADQHGVKFTAPGSSTTLRYERIIEISTRERTTLFGSLKRKNAIPLVLMAPLVLLVYILTVGYVNLFRILYNPFDPVEDENDRMSLVSIKTRGTSVNFRIVRSQNPEFSRIMGILVFMTKLESRNIKIDKQSIFAAQRQY